MAPPRAQSRGVGVVADEPAILHDDRVDRAHRGRARRQLVEQRHHDFLAGKVTLTPAKPSRRTPSSIMPEPGCIGAGDLDQLVVAAQRRAPRRPAHAWRVRRNAQSARRSGR